MKFSRIAGVLLLLVLFSGCTPSSSPASGEAAPSPAAVPAPAPAPAYKLKRMVYDQMNDIVLPLANGNVAVRDIAEGVFIRDPDGNRLTPAGAYDGLVRESLSPDGYVVFSKAVKKTYPLKNGGTYAVGQNIFTLCSQTGEAVCTLDDFQGRLYGYNEEVLAMGVPVDPAVTPAMANGPFVYRYARLDGTVLYESPQTASLSENAMFRNGAAFFVVTAADGSAQCYRLGADFKAAPVGPAAANGMMQVVDYDADYAILKVYPDGYEGTDYDAHLLLLDAKTGALLTDTRQGDLVEGALVEYDRVKYAMEHKGYTLADVESRSLLRYTYANLHGFVRRASGSQMVLGYLEDGDVETCWFFWVDLAAQKLVRSERLLYLSENGVTSSVDNNSRTAFCAPDGSVVATYDDITPFCNGAAFVREESNSRTCYAVDTDFQRISADFPNDGGLRSQYGIVRFGGKSEALCARYTPAANPTETLRDIEYYTGPHNQYYAFYYGLDDGNELTEEEVAQRRKEELEAYRSLPDKKDSEVVSASERSGMFDDLKRYGIG